MLLAELAATSAAVAGTRSRTAKIDALTAAVARLADDELEAGLAFLAGHPTQDRLGAGWAAVGAVDAPPADRPTLTVAEVDAVLDELAATEGSGSQAERDRLLTELWSRATADEQSWLRGVLLREVRQGASDSLVQSAIATACDVPVAAVRRAVFLTDDPARAARAARAGGVEALAAIRLTPGRFVQPMLASTAGDVSEAVEEMGEVVVDTKLDGARVQVHVDGDTIRVFTRNGNDVTARLPEVVAVARQLDVERGVFDGEAIAIDAHGRPRAFGDTMGRFGTEDDSPVRAAAGDERLSVFLFDVLAASGGASERVRADWDGSDDSSPGPDVIDEPLHRRLALLDAVVPAEHRVSRLRTSDPGEALPFVQEVLEHRHEGVMLKEVDSRYAAGRRGKAWRKVKPIHTLDLVVLAVEWGSGRRRGWLSNLHLGAYDPDADDWVMLGKTFKGLTDEMLQWQTDHLLALEERRTSHVVHVRPSLVVETALDGFVASPRYPARIAMRFARVKHHRPDKTPRDADTVETCLAIARGEIRPHLA